MKTTTLGRMAALTLLTSGLAMAGASQAQTPSPGTIFRTTMTYASQVQAAAAPVNARTAKAGETLAMANAATEAAVGTPPRSDDKGYYFSFAQTADYDHTKANERLGVRTPREYETLRCRRAPSLQSSGAPAEDIGTWRVCPDAQGRYRVTL